MHRLGFWFYNHAQHPHYTAALIRWRASPAVNGTPAGLRGIALAARRGVGAVFCVFFLFFVLEVFVVVLVCFFFRFGSRSWRSRVFRCASRSEAASVLRRFRAARRWWRSPLAPPLSVVGGARVPRSSLRWLAARWVVVSVSCWSRRWVVPSGRFVRRPSAFVPACWSSFAAHAAAVFGG